MPQKATITKNAEDEDFFYNLGSGAFIPQRELEALNNSERLYTKDETKKNLTQIENKEDLVAFIKHFFNEESFTNEELDEKVKNGEIIKINNYQKQDGNTLDGYYRKQPIQLFVKPAEGEIRDYFGPRPQPTPGASTDHKGIDIGVPIGTPVRAIADGKVYAANDGMVGYGKGVFIDHGNFNGKLLVSEYGHLNNFNVKVGDTVKKGQVIAESGNTGVSTAPHLHLTIREGGGNGVRGEAIDPLKYIKW